MDGSPAPSGGWCTGVVREVTHPGPRAVRLRIEVAGRTDHLPGQHYVFRLTAEDGYSASRSYSVASAPGDPLLEFYVERLDDGEVSTYLADVVQPGDELELRGPIGGYFTWTGAGGRPLQLLAGGSGIVPLMAMLRTRARAQAPSPARLLYSSRTWATTIYRDELAQLAASDRSLTVVHALTRATPPEWTGQSRRVDGPMLRALAFPPDEAPEMFVCGPTPFVESVATLLVDWGHAAPAIKTERFGPTGGPPQEDSDGPNG
jgi:ferredoxin-NADP reductase